MSDAIVRNGGTGLSPQTFEQAQAFAEKLANARGFVPSDLHGKPDAVLACIMTGSEMGIGPMLALRSIHMVKGRPVLSADLMLSQAIRSGIKHQWIEQTGKVATVRLSREGWDPHTHSYTIEEAAKAGLSRKDNWRAYAPAMLRARCISGALRAYCPDVLGAGVYVEGEIEDGADGREPVPAVVHQPDDDIVDADLADPGEPVLDRALALVAKGDLDAARDLWSALSRAERQTVSEAVQAQKNASNQAAAEDAMRDENEADNPAEAAE